MKTQNQRAMENVQQPQVIEQEPSFWVPPPPKPEPMWSRNLVILVFVAFIAGLMLGKIMHPTILNLKH